MQNPDASLERALLIFQQSSQKDHAPLTMIAINNGTGLPVAMGSLWERDGEEWPDKTPWIASIYTLYRYRGLGLALRIKKPA